MIVCGASLINTYIYILNNTDDKFESEDEDESVHQVGAIVITRNTGFIKCR